MIYYFLCNLLFYICILIYWKRQNLYQDLDVFHFAFLSLGSFLFGAIAGCFIGGYWFFKLLFRLVFGKWPEEHID